MTTNPPQRPPAALVIGLCSHGVAVARALHRAGIAVYALEQDLLLPGARTNAVRKVFQVSDMNGEQLIPALLALRQQLGDHEQVVLMPINDNQVRELGRGFAALQGHYLLSWAECSANVLRLQTKSELETISRERGLNYPKSAVVADGAEASAALADFRYPVIIKPVQPLSSFKTALAEDRDELAGLLERYRADLPILVQEYIAGGDDALYFGALTLERGRLVQGMVGQKKASFPPAMGQTTIAEAVVAPEVLALTEQFFDGFALSGPVSLELKKAPDGSFWVIEPTVGRTDFWAELCMAARFNQPLQEYRIALGQAPDARELATNVAWYDTQRSPLAYWRAAWRHKSLRPRGKRPAFAFFALHDPRPFLHSCLELAGRTCQRFAMKNGFGNDGASGADLEFQQFDMSEALPADVHAWLAQHQCHPIFATPDWFAQLAAFERETGNRNRLSWLVVRRDGTPLLAAPLEYYPGRLGQVQLGLFRNFYTPSIELVVDAARLSREQAWTTLFAALDRLHPGWLNFLAAPLKPEQRRVLLQACGHERACHSQRTSINHTVQIPDLAAYWKARPSRLNTTLKRKGKSLAKVEHRFELTRDPSPQQVEHYWEIYQHSWKQNEPSRSFITWLMGWSARNGFLRLGLLYVGEKVVACQFWLAHAKVGYIFKLAQDMSADQYSPGSLLTEFMINSLAEQDQMEKIDFLLGDDGFKPTWMDQKTPAYIVETVNRKSLIGVALHAYYWLRRHGRRRAPRAGAPTDAATNTRE